MSLYRLHSGLDTATWHSEAEKRRRSSISKSRKRIVYPSIPRPSSFASAAACSCRRRCRSTNGAAGSGLSTTAVSAAAAGSVFSLVGVGGAGARASTPAAAASGTVSGGGTAASWVASAGALATPSGAGCSACCWAFRFASLAALNLRRASSRSAFSLAIFASYSSRWGHLVPGGRLRSHASKATNICRSFSSGSSRSHCMWFRSMVRWSRLSIPRAYSALAKVYSCTLWSRAHDSDLFFLRFGSAMADRGEPAPPAAGGVALAAAPSGSSAALGSASPAACTGSVSSGAVKALVVPDSDCTYDAGNVPVDPSSSPSHHPSPASLFVTRITAPALNVRSSSSSVGPKGYSAR
mmetsp:Transcript_20375/g.52918  ORF Transcript_20375/g.52918 Transcript_20375/m.52918 type:complete len:352 (+) Transcript_20375:1408-2463(+)